MSSPFIVFSSSDFYVPYLSVCLTSLMAKISKNKKYEIRILENGIADSHKVRLSQSIDNDACNLEFVSLNRPCDKFQCHHHVSKETFFKIYIPELFKNEEKVLFCDGDIIFEDDPAKLFDIDMGNKPLAAGLCHHWNGLIHFHKPFYDYTVRDLGIENPNLYIQGGILLFNNRVIQRADVDSLSDLAQSRRFHNHDQDVLNMYFKNKVHILSSVWNYETIQAGFQRTSVPCMDIKHKSEWEEASKKPKIIHYSGREKPWFYPEEDKAHIWWEYARHTPFYEEIIARLIDFRLSTKLPHVVERDVQQIRDEFKVIHFPNINHHFAENERNTRLLYVIEHPMMLKFRKWRYAARRAFSSGEKRKKYQQKYDATKNLLEEAKELKKVLRRV